MDCILPSIPNGSFPDNLESIPRRRSYHHNPVLTPKPWHHMSMRSPWPDSIQASCLRSSSLSRMCCLSASQPCLLPVFSRLMALMGLMAQLVAEALPSDLGLRITHALGPSAKPEKSYRLTANILMNHAAMREDPYGTSITVLG